MNAPDNPLTAPVPEEVPLPRAPLVRVIAQVRFPTILSVQRPEFVAPFQEAIRTDYPILQEEHSQPIRVGPQGIEPGEGKVTWRFAESSEAWRVSLTPEFVALETTAYGSRTEFIQRVSLILRAAEEHLRPSVAGRVGLRYIDRVTGEELERISDLIRPEMLGIVNTPLFDNCEHEISDALLRLPGASEYLRARWGHLPPGRTLDPNAIEPIDERSWVLDLDLFSIEQRPFNAGDLVNDLQRFAERIYTVFRWSVTEEFLRRYGGLP